MKNKWNMLYLKDIEKNGGFTSYYSKKIKIRKKILYKIKKYAKTTVLEAGCGTGVLSIYLSNIGYESWAVDNDDLNLKLVKSISMATNSRCPNLLNKDIFKLYDFFDNGSIDVIYSIGVYEHFSDDEIKKLINIQLEISKYVMIGIPTKYFNENEKLYGNERFMSISEWKKILNTQNVNIVEEFFMNNQNLIKRILNYKKWFKIPPIYVFVIKKGE